MSAIKLKSLIIVSILAGTGPVVSGCGGMINVEASGGGASGFASLGAIVLGTSALIYLRDKDARPRQDVDVYPPPDDVMPEAEESP